MKGIPVAPIASLSAFLQPGAQRASGSLPVKEGKTKAQAQAAPLLDAQAPDRRKRRLLREAGIGSR